jgi:hypothetical protein
MAVSARTSQAITAIGWALLLTAFVAFSETASPLRSRVLNVYRFSRGAPLQVAKSSVVGGADTLIIPSAAHLRLTRRSSHADSNSNMASASGVDVTVGRVGPHLRADGSLKPGYTEDGRRLKDPWGCLLGKIAVLVVGGQNRTANLRAAYDSWTQPFQWRMFLTDADPALANVSTDMQGMMHNVYSKHATERDALAAHAHPDHPIFKFLDRPAGDREAAHPFNAADSSTTRELYSEAHGIGWHLSQPKYLLGLQAMRTKFPNADWYLLADSDTLMFPRRLALHTRLLAHNASEAVYLGAIQTTRMENPDRSLRFPLGGAGIIISRGAMASINVSECVERQRTDLQWSTAPADWRVGLCMELGDNVKRMDPLYLYQSNENFDCLP